MEKLLDFLNNVLFLANSMSIYILIGLLIAGLLKELLPNDFVSSHLGKGGTASVIKATLFGIPMPVCSCSVIPLAKSLQKEGASKGAVQSFLISTPITGADSILATASFFGWFFTLYRVVTSVIIAITAGILQNIFDKKEEKRESIFQSKQSGFGNSFGANSNTAIRLQPLQKKPAETSCCSDSACCASESKSSKKFRISNLFSYAINTLFKDIYKSLFWGILIGAMFTTFLPKELLAPLFEHKILSYFAVLIIAMPMYVCATASLPIAAAFLIGGMSPGAAFVFLSAGPATNTVTMGVVASMFGKRSLVIYISIIALMSILFGAIFDNFFSSLDTLSMAEHTENFSMLEYGATAVMFALIGYFAVKKSKIGSKFS